MFRFTIYMFDVMGDFVDRSVHGWDREAGLPSWLLESNSDNVLVSVFLHIGRCQNVPSESCDSRQPTIFVQPNALRVDVLGHSMDGFLELVVGMSMSWLFLCSCFVSLLLFGKFCLVFERLLTQSHMNVQSHYNPLRKWVGVYVAFVSWRSLFVSIRFTDSVETEDYLRQTLLLKLPLQLCLVQNEIWICGSGSATLE